MNMNIFIGGAWPYANDSLHLGRVTALLQGDILARYFRQKGDRVLYVSGSDCHGTPISIRAVKEGVAPGQIADRYHREFEECFQKLGFSYDLYTRTDQPHHHKVVQELFLKLLENRYIYKKRAEQTYCESCSQFLPDRYVEGVCPHCGSIARGDQCDACSALLDPVDLKDKKCKICGSAPVQKDTEHFYLALSGFQKVLEEYLENAEGWRENAIHLTRRYLNEGLQDRAATRDLPWGIDIPLEGYEGKKIYVWIEAVCGYLSASRLWAERTGEAWEPFWNEEAVAYYVHGKDNIPFHTLILPALLLGAGNLHLPDRIISCEYLTLEGKKFSTSRNWAVWVPYILEHYNPDSVRYFLAINGPEKRDTDFSWREFILSHNGELLGAFGNFVNRTLVFVQKSFEGKVPKGVCEPRVQKQIEEVYRIAGDQIEAGEFRSALENIFVLVRAANKYFDERQPWIKVRENADECAEILHTCIQIIANLSNLLSPFVPFSCDKIRDYLGISGAGWRYLEVASHSPIKPSAVLFKRIDKVKIEEESARLG
jgi:methionyl-tRNA synthetase